MVGLHESKVWQPEGAHMWRHGRGKPQIYGHIYIRHALAFSFGPYPLIGVEQIQ